MKEASLTRRGRFVLRGSVAAIVALFCVATFGAERAFAHAAAESTSPAQGAVLPHSPAVLSVSFSEPVVIARAPKLSDAKGATIPTGVPRVETAGRKLVVPVEKLVHGTYVLNWRVESGDGHPVQGAFAFSVGMPTMGAELQALARQSAGDASVGGLYALLRAFSFGFVITAIGGGIFLVAIARGAQPDSRGERVLTMSMVGLAIVSGLSLLNIGPYIRGGNLGDVFTGEGLSDVFDNDLGKAIGARLVLALFGLVVTRVALRYTQNGQRWVPTVIVGTWSLLTIATYSYAGHPRTGRWQTLAFVLDELHLGAASVWIGGLVFLLVVTLRRPLGDLVLAEQQSLRFSHTATVSVVVVAVTGVVQAFRQLAALNEVWDSTYGRFLVLKVIGVGAILLLAATSRKIVHRDLEGEIAHLHRLRKKVVLETGIAVVVIALTAGLVNAGPPRELVAVEPIKAQPVTKMGSTDTMHFQVTFSPGSVGMNVLTIDSMNLRNAPMPLVEMQVILSPTTGDHPPVTIPIGLRDGVYHADNVFIPYSGVWRVHIVAVTGPVDQVETDVNVTIP